MFSYVQKVSIKVQHVKDLRNYNRNSERIPRSLLQTSCFQTLNFGDMPSPLYFFPHDGTNKVTCFLGGCLLCRFLLRLKEALAIIISVDIHPIL